MSMQVVLRKTIDKKEIVLAMQEEAKDSNSRPDPHSESPMERPYTVAVDVGATHLRIGIMGSYGLLSDGFAQYPSLSKQ
jgi:hypothetical protein